MQLIKPHNDLNIGDYIFGYNDRLIFFAEIIAIQLNFSLSIIYTLHKGSVEKNMSVSGDIWDRYRTDDIYKLDDDEILKNILIETI